MQDNVPMVIPPAGRKPIRRGPMRNARQVEEVPDSADSIVSNVDKRNICVQVLKDGFVQSYVDLFYLTHRPDPNPDENGILVDREVEISMSEMNKLRDNLTTAESAKREGNTQVVYDCYHRLATYFQFIEDVKTGIFFYEKCLEIARLTLDKKGELMALHNLGIAHSQSKEFEQAISYHERQAELATSINSAEELQTANIKLIEVYRLTAEDLENDNLNDAIQVYHNCLQAARQADEPEQIGTALYRIGKLCLKLNRAPEAVAPLEEYFQICCNRDDLKGEAAAASALAEAYQYAGNVADATQYFQRSLEIAERTENINAQADACSHLGVFLNNRKDFAEASKMFQRSYDLARTILNTTKGNRSTLDIARVNLAMARGNERMESFCGAINEDLAKLLKWKVQRVKV